MLSSHNFGTAADYLDRVSLFETLCIEKGSVGMPVMEGYVDTVRAARYVEQLSNHFAHQPGGMRLLEQKPGELLIDLGPATWRIVAEPDRLVLTVECPDTGQLAEVSAHLAERIEQIGRRDGLHVQWQPVPEA
jgi:hypothetical protein